MAPVSLFAQASCKRPVEALAELGISLDHRGGEAASDSKPMHKFRALTLKIVKLAFDQRQPKYRTPIGEVEAELSRLVERAVQQTRTPGRNGAIFTVALLCADPTCVEVFRRVAGPAESLCGALGHQNINATERQWLLIALTEIAAGAQGATRLLATDLPRFLMRLLQDKGAAAGETLEQKS